MAKTTVIFKQVITIPNKDIMAGSSKIQLISVSSVLLALSDPKVLAIFDSIALSEVDREFLVSHLNLSPKEYYSRVSRLLKAGVITRKNGKYSVTSFGKLISHAQNLIGVALTNYWKLSAIDSLQASCSLPLEEYRRIVNSLVNDNWIREVLTRESPNNIAEPQHLGDGISPSIQTHQRRLVR